MSDTDRGKGELNSVEVKPLKVRQAQAKVFLSRCSRTQRTRNKQYANCEDRSSIMNHRTVRCQWTSLGLHRTVHAAASAGNHVFTAARKANARAPTEIAPGSASGYSDDEFQDAGPSFVHDHSRFGYDPT